MKIFYHINKTNFMILDDERQYIVSLPKNQVILLKDITFESVLRQGYWQVAENIDEEIKEECFSLVKKKSVIDQA